MTKKKGSGAGLLFLLLFTAIIVVGISKYKDDILRRFYPIQYSDYVYKYSSEYNVDPFLVFSIIRVESNFNPAVQSKVGAKGLMQITDSTAKWAAKKMKISDHSSGDLFDPEYNIRMGCWYLNNLISHFDGNVILALTAYNGGSGNVEKWLKNAEYSKTGEKLDNIPFGETRRYVDRVKKDYSVYKNLYGK